MDYKTLQNIDLLENKIVNVTEIDGSTYSDKDLAIKNKKKINVESTETSINVEAPQIVLNDKGSADNKVIITGIELYVDSKTVNIANTSTTNINGASNLNGATSINGSLTTAGLNTFNGPTNIKGSTTLSGAETTITSNSIKLGKDDKSSNINIKANNLASDVANTASLTADKITLAATTSIDASSKDITINSSDSVDLTGKDVKVKGTTTTSIEGEFISIKGTGASDPESSKYSINIDSDYVKTSGTVSAKKIDAEKINATGELNFKDFRIYWDSTKNSIVFARP